MELSSLFALPDGLEVAGTSVTGPVLTLSLVATSTTALCPLCGHVSQHIRSSYTRRVADVPAAGRQVQLTLRVRKFRWIRGAARARSLQNDWHLSSNHGLV